MLWQYFLSLRKLTNVLGHLLLVGYRTFPTATIEGQLEDLAAALTFLEKNRRLWNRGASERSESACAARKLLLMGHSSGAHLVVTHALRRAAAEATAGAAGETVVAPLSDLVSSVSPHLVPHSP